MSGLGVAAVIRCYDNKPILIVFTLPTFDSIPYFSDLFISRHNCVVKLWTVAKLMAHIVGEFKVYPGQVGRFAGNHACCLIRYRFVYTLNEYAGRIMRKVDGVVFKP